jgi:acyl carrier protein
MKRSDLKAIVAEILEIETGSLGSDFDLRSIETFDSVTVLTLMIALDEQAGVKLSPADANALRFYGDIEKAVAKQGIELLD